MVITFTLQAAYSGATYVAGPFDISGTTSGGVTTLLGDNISKASLLTGVTISDINDATTGGTIQSVDGTCSNSIQWLVTSNEPTPTPTPMPEITYNCVSGVCEEVYDGTGTYSLLSQCQSACQQTIYYYCRESEFAPCQAQLNPCTGNQIVCTEFEQPQ